MPHIIARRSRAHRSVVPSFFLYGESPRAVPDRFLHLEALDNRCRPSHWNIRAHAHADLSHVFLIDTGAGEMFSEAQAVEFAAPCLLLVPAGVVHGFLYEPETTGTVLTLAAAYLRELMCRESSFAALFAAPACVPLADAGPIGESLARLSRELVSIAPARAAAIEAHLLAILVAALRVGAAPAAPLTIREGPAGRLVERFRDTIERDYLSRRDVDAYAAALGVSAGRLRRACQAVSGCSPIRLIQDRLLREAKRALVYSNMTIAQTAYYLGFDDPAYFSRFFSKRERLSPRAFRAHRIGLPREHFEPLPQ
ncbi:MAG TPA: helix-turn-helix domain-containing protein [Steroidobacteraceae bacterium]|jgi:AraC family transcriptional activator of pobA|nr:helix-turn-helix domain-containing protein [Steroidobacteraceae bacterium]